MAYKWQPSLNKIHTHGNDIRPVKKKQNCAFSEKWVRIAPKTINDTDNM